MAGQAMWAMWNRGAGLCALVQPYLAGRRVAELWSETPDDGELLRQAGAAEVFSLTPDPGDARLPLDDGTVDMVLCPSFLPEGSPDDRAHWLGEIARVLSPTGVLVLRAPVGALGDEAALSGDAGDAPEPAGDEHAADEHAVDEASHEAGDVGAGANGVDGAAGQGAGGEAVADAADLQGGGSSEVAGGGHEETGAGAAMPHAEPDVTGEVVAVAMVEIAEGEVALRDEVPGQGAEAAPADEASESVGGDLHSERRAAWQQVLPAAFVAVDVLEELPFGGVSFRVPATEDLAIVGDLSPLEAPADFEIVFGSKDAATLPRFAESMLVPLGGHVEALPEDEEGGENDGYDTVDAESVYSELVGADELVANAEGDAGGDSALAEELEQLSADLAAATAAREEAERERDQALLAAASEHDREGSRDATISSLRAAVERQLQRLADIEVTLGRVGSERDDALRRAEAAEEALHDAEAALRRREWEVAGLSRDLDRFGRPPGPKG